MDRKKEAGFLSEIVLRTLFFYVIFILFGFFSSFWGFSLLHLNHTISIKGKKLKLSRPVQHPFSSFQCKSYMQ